MVKRDKTMKFFIFKHPGMKSRLEEITWKAKIGWIPFRILEKFKLYKTLTGEVGRINNVRFIDTTKKEGKW